jgi:hypothetical protein
MSEKPQLPDTTVRLPGLAPVGEADRLPAPMAGNAPEGMLMGPDHPAFGQSPPRNVQGPVPPNARFEPIFTPTGSTHPSAIDPNAVPMGPDRDEFLPPGVDPMTLGPRPPAQPEQPGQTGQQPSLRLPGQGFPGGGPFGSGGFPGFR